MKITIQKRLLIFSIILLAINGFLGYAAFKSHQKHETEELNENEAELVISELTSISSLGKDIVIASRGFVITNDSVCLEPLYNAEQTIFLSIAKLKQLTRDDPAQQKRIDSLNFYMSKRLAFSLQVIELRKKKGLSFAIADISANRGWHYNSRISKIVNSINDAENKKLTEHSNERNEAALGWFTALMFVLMTVFTILLLISLGKNIQQNKDREKREAELVIANKELLVQNERSAHLAAIVESSENAIISRSLDGKIKSWNKGAEKIYGFTAEEVVGKPTPMIVPTEDVENINRMLERVGQNEIIEGYEAVRMKKSGELFNASLYLSPMKDKAGKVIGISVITSDITVRKKAESELVKKTEELVIANMELAFRNEDIKKRTEDIITAKEKVEESEFRFKLAVHSGKLGIWDWNVKDNVMVWDDRMFEFYGITPNTFNNNIDVWTNGLHPEDKQRAVDECNAALNGENDFNTSFRVLRPDGKIFYLKADAVVIRDIDGKPMRMIGINSDISERKLSEELLLSAKEKVEESELNYRLLFENVNAAITIYDQDNRIVMTNNINAKLIGRPATDLIGKSLYDIFPDLADYHAERFRKIISTNKGASFEDVFHFRDGTMQWFSTMIHPITNSSKMTSGVQIVAINITERKLAEMELNNAKEKAEENEKRFKDISESAGDWIWEVDKNGIYTYSSSKAADFLGLKTEEIIGKTPFDFMPPEEAEKAAVLFSEIIANKLPIKDLENWNINKNGELRCMLTNGLPIIDKDGNLKGYRGIDKDITIIKNAELALKEKNEKYAAINEELNQTNAELLFAKEKAKENLRLLLESQKAAHIGSFETDINNRTWKASPEVANIFGIDNTYPRTLESWINTIHPDSRAKLFEYHSQAEKEKKRFDHEYKIIRLNDGTERWAHGIGEFEYDNKSNPIKLIGTIQDITERKNAELLFQKIYKEKEEKTAELIIAKEKAEKSERLFLESQEVAHIGSFAADLIARTWDASPELHNISGIDITYPHTMEGWAGIMHPESRAPLFAYHLEVETEKKRFDYQNKIIRINDGAERWVHTLAELIYDDQLNPVQLIGTVQDITERKNAELLLHKINEEKEKRTEELIAANNELTTFTYVSSHDLQEPLRKLQVFADMILEEEEKNLSEKGKGLFKRMQQNAMRMQALIEDLLIYSRTKTTENTFEKIDLNIILDEVKINFEDVILEKKAIIKTIGICEVKVIPFQFRQLVQNLISNSLKFSKPDFSPKITIECTIEKGDTINMTSLNEEAGQKKPFPDINYSHIVYTDNGIGFDTQYQSRIFDVFQRLHSYEEYKGTGIGLAICKRIADNHKGIITASGELNKGARFDIYIPA